MDSTVIYPRTDRWVYAGSDPDDPKGKSGDGRASDPGKLQICQEINATNVRIKAAMEQQLIGHQDSIGKIYQITSRLEQQMPDIYQELAERRVYINQSDG